MFWVLKAKEHCRLHLCRSDPGEVPHWVVVPLTPFPLHSLSWLLQGFLLWLQRSITTPSPCYVLSGRAAPAKLVSQTTGRQWCQALGTWKLQKLPGKGKVSSTSPGHMSSAWGPWPRAVGEVQKLWQEIMSPREVQSKLHQDTSSHPLGRILSKPRKTQVLAMMWKNGNPWALWWECIMQQLLRRTV